MPVRHARSEARGRPPSADEVELARTVRQDPATDLEAARRPYPYALLGSGLLYSRRQWHPVHAPTSAGGFPSSHACEYATRPDLGASSVRRLK